MNPTFVPLQRVVALSIAASNACCRRPDAEGPLGVVARNAEVKLPEFVDEVIDELRRLGQDAGPNGQLG